MIGYLIKLFSYKKFFYPFPNPHIRTTGFLIKGSEYFAFMKKKSIKSKIDAWKVERGKDTLTNFFKKSNFNIYVINSDGNKFSENYWKESQTFNYLDQKKSIISDNHIRKYNSLNKNERYKFQINTWGRD